MTADTMRCEECRTTVTNPAAHETHYHDGAQTCWPHPTEKDLFLNALGSLLASTMVSDLDEDLCESR